MFKFDKSGDSIVCFMSKGICCCQKFDQTCYCEGFITPEPENYCCSTSTGNVRPRPKRIQTMYHRAPGLESLAAASARDAVLNWHNAETPCKLTWCMQTPSHSTVASAPQSSGLAALNPRTSAAACGSEAPSSLPILLSPWGLPRVHLLLVPPGTFKS